MELKKVAPEQVREWLDSPVTVAFKLACELERDESAEAKGVDFYHPYEPHKTQEILAGLNGAVDTWEVVIEALEELADEQGEQYDGEYFRD